MRSTTKANTNAPEWDEAFALLVDDASRQRLRVAVRDDDFGWGDKVIGVAEVALSEVRSVVDPV